MAVAVLIQHALPTPAPPRLRAACPQLFMPIAKAQQQQQQQAVDEDMH